MKIEENSYWLTDKGQFGSIALALGVIGLFACAVGYYVDSEQFFYSYLTAFVFWTTVALGGLFFVMLHYLVGAKWSIVLRRLSENMMIVIPLMALLTIPLLFGIHDLFEWSHADVVKTDALLQGKAAYLNMTFFIIRSVLYFVLWIFLARYLYGLSLKQDNQHSESLFIKARRASAPGMILFALSITFFSFDWMMSLDAHWYSTIFGVYIFSGAFLGSLAFLTIIVLYLRKRNILKDAITVEHYHDLGKLMFAFTVFWGYMAFSQYLLIWYGNIPEETIWFLNRWGNSWRMVTLFIVFGNFVIPFFLLFPQWPKKNPIMLGALSMWVLFVHWVDMYWIVMPSLHKQGLHISWVDFAALIGIGGLFVWYFWNKLASHVLVPIKDPGLIESKEFVNS